MSVSVNTSSYQFSHGKAPRGTGGWAFFIGSSKEPVFFYGSYSEARKQAVQAAREAGAYSVTVGA